MIQKLLLMLWLLLPMFSCNDELKQKEEILVTLIDMSGLDGCGWALEVSTDERLEPVNLHEFTIELLDSSHYYVTYSTQNAASICMIGHMVEIQTIEKAD